MMTMDRNLTWIASFPKSGNTWVRIIIDRLLHPERPLDLNGIEEDAPYFAAEVSRFLRAQNMRVDAQNPTAIRRFWFAGQQHIAQSSKEQVFLKTHNIAATFDTGPFPSPEFTRAALYVVRDPRDVALSYAHHYRCSLKDAVGAMLNPRLTLSKSEEPEKTELLKSWGDHVTAWTAEKPYPLLVMRYEDMLDDPATQIARIAEFFNLPCDTARAKQIAEETRFDRLKREETEKGFGEAANPVGFFRAGTSQQWKAPEHKRTLAPLTKAFASIMKTFGYR